MRYQKTVKYFWVLLLTATFLPEFAIAAEELPHADTYVLHPSEFKKLKNMIDDPEDLVATYPIEKAVPSEICKFLVVNVEEAERQSEALMGFKAPDLMGKIAPEIKPGKYTYKDLAQSPGLKELFPPEALPYIRPGGPPLIGAIPEFEIIPTRQFYRPNKFLEITKLNLGKTKLDKDGYIVPRSWQGGIPFPKPSGKFKAQQIYYNFEKKMETWDFSYFLAIEARGFDKKLFMDHYAEGVNSNLKLMGRSVFPPFGWFDERAERNGEYMANSTALFNPRAQRGTVVLQYRYDDPNKLDPWMVYVPSLRRIRKMQATDTQDPQGDQAYDDRSHLTQKITPKKFPYKFEIIAEREYLLAYRYANGAMCFDSKNGYAMKGVQLMRRPCYVLQMTQLDNNYVYSKRVLYVDKETFGVQLSAAYDQKGQLYRSQFMNYVFFPEYGMISQYGTLAVQTDHIDNHATAQAIFPLPGIFLRKDFAIEGMIKRGK
jgi:hypothetical protein